MDDDLPNSFCCFVWFKTFSYLIRRIHVSGDRGRERGRDRDRGRDFGRDRDRDRGDRDRWRNRESDRGRRYERGYDRFRGPRDRSREGDRSKERDRSRERGRSRERDRSRERGRSRERDRSRERGRSKDRDRSRERGRSPEHRRSRERNADPEKGKVPRSRDRSRESNERDKSRESEQDKRKSRSRGNSRNKDDVETREPGKEEKTEPDVLRKGVEESENSEEKSGIDSKSGAEKKGNDDDKGGWKTLESQSISDERKDDSGTKGIAKPFFAQGFGFSTSGKKVVSLKSATNLAAKPSLFEEESEPEKKLDMFSTDAEDNVDKNTDEKAAVKTDAGTREDSHNSAIHKAEDTKSLVVPEQSVSEEKDNIVKVMILS